MLAPSALRADGTARRLTQRVWRGHLATTGQAVALKLATPSAPLRGEVATLGWLHRQGCAVPQVVAVDPQPEPVWVALEWCGDLTLDQSLQVASPQRRRALGRRLAQAFVEIEAAFAPVTAQSRAGTAQWNARQQALRALVEPWAAAAPEALAWLLGRPLRSDEAQALQATVEAALTAKPDVGSLDYNASNVVLKGPRLTFVDWATVGVDWPQRRFVQYGTATGAGDGAEGNFASAITQGTLRTYASLAAAQRGVVAAEVAQTVDAHDVLLLLTAATSLKLVADGTAHAERAAAWGTIEDRRKRLIDLLRRRLVDEGPAEELRRRLRTRNLASTRDAPRSPWQQGIRSHQERAGRGGGR